jgi:hypothetical protein
VNIEVAHELRGAPCILTRDGTASAQNFNGTKGDIAQVADRRADYE